MERVAALQALGEYTSGQLGMITTAQAAQLGVDHVTLLRLANAGLLETVTRGVHRLTGTGADRHVELRAQWLRLDMERPSWERLTVDDATAVVSHRSAAELHGLGDIPAPSMEFTVPQRRRSRVDDVEFHVGTLTMRDITVVDGLPVTTPLRTVADLAAEGIDGGHLGGICADILSRGLASRAELATAVEAGVRKYDMLPGAGDRLLEHLLHQVGSRSSIAAMSTVLQPRLAEAIQIAIELIARDLPPNTDLALMAGIPGSTLHAVQEAMSRIVPPLSSQLAGSTRRDLIASELYDAPAMSELQKALTTIALHTKPQPTGLPNGQPNDGTEAPAPKSAKDNTTEVAK